MVPTHMHSDNNRNNASHLFLFAFKHSYSKNTNTPPYQNPPARVSTREERRGVRVGVSPLNFHIALVTAIHHARKTIQTRKRATKDETDENSTIQQLAKINKGIEKQKTTRLVYARTRCPPCLPACLPLVHRSRVIYHTQTHDRPNRTPSSRHYPFQPFHQSIITAAAAVCPATPHPTKNPRMCFAHADIIQYWEGKKDSSHAALELMKKRDKGKKKKGRIERKRKKENKNFIHDSKTPTGNEIHY